MTYEQAQHATVTRQEAIRELQAHGASLSEFFADVGDKTEYVGSEVLDWLGY